MNSDVDKYVGQLLSELRKDQGVSVIKAAQVLGLTPKEYRLGEAGMRRFYLSDIFTLRRCFEIPINGFFTSKGVYISDLGDASTVTEMADVVHYFTSIGDGNVRRALIEQMRRASSRL